jgi:hypothetical protein
MAFAAAPVPPPGHGERNELVSLTYVSQRVIALEQRERSSTILSLFRVDFGLCPSAEHRTKTLH